MKKILKAFQLETIFDFYRKNHKSVIAVLYILVVVNISYVFYKDHLSRQDDKQKDINNIERVMKTIKALPDPSKYWNEYKELQGLLNQMQSDSLTPKQLNHIKRKTDELYKGN